MPEGTPQPVVPLRPLVEAEHRGHPHGKAQEEGHQQKLGVEHDGDGGYPRLAQQLQYDDVEEKGGDGGRQVGHHLGGAVKAGPAQQPPAHLGAGKAQPLLPAQEKEHAAHRRNAVTGDGGHGRPRNAQGQGAHVQPVQHAVGEPGGEGEAQPQAGPARRHKKALKQQLEHGKGGEHQQDAQIAYRIRHQQIAGPQQPGQ